MIVFLALVLAAAGKVVYDVRALPNPVTKENQGALL